ncbi:MAG: xanthine dehydrogenase family protein molybdopterin-binding subunit [Anaerolineae bacterium]|nr:xanthine dehydrogenase family protein molybdopterin-binding subunit [Thermoflexales bacterium]MDW8406652.1 xanthine dehydrogenase family protein molybdopterin-binding subunit [Anaerolineae bacterium]
MAIGISIPRIDARSKVTGEALYPGDINLAGQAYAKVLWSKRPHARVRVIDTRAAEALPGVLAVFTGEDVPVNEYGLITFDAPVLMRADVRHRIPDRSHQTPASITNPNSQHPRLFDSVVRHVGEKVALVVAETEDIAAQARELIHVEYEDLPAITSMHEAIQPGALQLHPLYPDNVIKRYRVRKGDAQAAFAEADVIIEDVYSTGAQEHAYLQPEAGLGYIDEQGRVTVIVAGQWAHEDQQQIAHALNLPLEQVRVIYPAIGGAFGGREDMSVQIILALAAWKLRRPVKIIWSREESIIGHHKRHPMWFHAKLGAKRDGRLVAAQVELMSDAGPYAYTSAKVLGNATVMAVGPYDIPNVAIDAQTVVTNNLPTGAFRGFGAPQALFVAETQMNKLAAALNIDPIELRLKNALREGSLTVNNTPVPAGCTIAEVIRRCAEQTQAHPKSTIHNPQLRIGRGFACGHKNIGFSFGAPERCEATVELHGDSEIERAVVYHAGADCGQGAHTVFAQVAAQALQLPMNKIELVVSDTASSGNSGSASASRMTFMAAHAIFGAASAALDKWRDEERPARAHYVYRAPPTTAMDPETGMANPNITYGYVAQSAEVEVDTETGRLRVLRLVCADDVGRAVNPQQVVGQIEGGAVMGLGWTALEHFVQRDGYVLTDRLSTYLIPSVLDIPDVVESIIVENPDPHGAMGIRGMAEMPLMVVAPAVVAAIYDATGVWMNTLPITPERLLSALERRLADTGTAPIR